MTKASKSERAEALARLREWLKPGDTVYTILRHVSRSGMSRTIDVIGIDPTEPGRIHAYGWNVAKALGMTFDRDREGVKVGGCGMDMGFHVVYSMSAAIFADGWECIGEGCPSNDHSNGAREACKACASCGYFDKDDVPIAQPEDMGGREWFELCAREGFTLCEECDGRGEVRREFPRGSGVIHRDSGYALRQRWL